MLVNLNKSRIYYWGPVIIWMAGIFYMSSQSAIQTSEVKVIDFIIHKIAHVAEYGMLSILLYRASNKGFKSNGNWKIPLFITIIYALTDEIHQLFVATREGRLRDVVIDSFGAAAGLWIQKQLLQIKIPKPKSKVK